MNRAERRAAMKGKKGKANAPSPEVIIAQARKSRDGLCFVLGILGCVLAGLWGVYGTQLSCLHISWV